MSYNSNNYNINNSTDDPFKTPKYKRPLMVPEIYPLNKINNHQQQQYASSSSPQQQHPSSPIITQTSPVNNNHNNNNNNNNNNNQSSTPLTDIDKQQYNIQIEILKKQIEILTQDTVEEFERKENELKKQIDSWKIKYDNLKEFSDTQDQLIKNQYFEIDKLTKKQTLFQNEQNRLINKINSQEIQISNLLETSNKNKKFSSDLLIKNSELQMKLVESENKIQSYQDGTIKINDINDKFNKQQYQETLSKLSELQIQNQKLIKDKQLQKSKSEQTLQLTLNEKLIEISTLSNQIEVLESKLIQESKLIDSINDRDNLIKNLELNQYEKDNEIQNLKGENEDLRLQIYETEEKYRSLLLQQNNSHGHTVVGSSSSNLDSTIINLAKKEVAKISSELLNIKDLLKFIDSTLLLPQNYQQQLFDDQQQQQQFDQSSLVNSMKFIREELVSLNQFIYKKCSLLLEIHESGQEFNINPSNCSLQ